MVNSDLQSKILQEHRPDASILTAKRQSVLRELQNGLKASVVSYIANVGNPVASMMPADIDSVMDLIKVAAQENTDNKNDAVVYLILESPGGDGNTAEKLIGMFRSVFTKGFYVIIPNLAKSAATMLSLGADKIIMGLSSELGPIDPQVQILLPSGQPYYTPAKSILGTIDKARDEISKNEKMANLYYPLLQQIRPEYLKYCEDALSFSEEFAKRWLPVGSMNGRTQTEIKNTVKELISGSRFNMHGSVISYNDARDVLRLNVDVWDNGSNLWSLVWEYYLRAKAFFQVNPGSAKLFESTKTSVNMAAQIIPLQQQKQ
ncbi:MAG: hypothetical protein M1410_04015 [Candidatus Thermoplasmatota archaeon]|nr:hypothetical protein [Candidatus Thermoplasmatota archaeon]